MASLRVRKLDDETLALHRRRAAAHGVSMEEEARQIIKRAVRAPSRVGDMALQLFGAAHGIALALPKHTPPHEPLNFSE